MGARVGRGRKRSLVHGQWSGQAWPDLSGPVGEAAGDVQQPVAQGASFGDGEISVEQQLLAPDEQAAGAQDHLHPRRVGGKAGERHPFESAVLGVLDPVLEQLRSTDRDRTLARYELTLETVSPSRDTSCARRRQPTGAYGHR